jgi:hypothetical protein
MKGAFVLACQELTYKHGKYNSQMMHGNLVSEAHCVPYDDELSSPEELFSEPVGTVQARCRPPDEAPRFLCNYDSCLEVRVGARTQRTVEE